MCVVDAAMNSGSEITPSPSRSGGVAAAVPVQLAGLAARVEAVGVDDRDDDRARSATRGRACARRRSGSRSPARRPTPWRARPRATHARGARRAGGTSAGRRGRLDVRRDLDALDLAALVRLVVQRDRADQARVVPHQRLHVLAVVEQPPVGGAAARQVGGAFAAAKRASAARSWRAARSGPGLERVGEVVVDSASGRRRRRTAPPRRSRGRRAPTGRARGPFSWFFRSRLAVCTRTSDAFTFPVVSIGKDSTSAAPWTSCRSGGTPGRSGSCRWPRSPRPPRSAPS